MAATRLICIPFAGAGAAAYRAWPAVLPGTIEPYALQLPGREERRSEPVITDWDVLIESAATAIHALSPAPIAIFGHSLGAIIALELARELQCNNSSRVCHLFCAARPWPGNTRDDDGRPREFNDETLLTYMENRYGALPPSFSNAEIKAETLPILKSDLQLLNAYQWRHAEKLTCPLTIIAGADDPITKTVDLNSWRSETANDFDVEVLNAGHFFVESHAKEISHIIADHLNS